MSQGIPPSGCGDRFSRSAGVPFSPTHLLPFCSSSENSIHWPACLRYLEVQRAASGSFEAAKKKFIDLPGLHYLEGKKEDGHVGPRRWGPITRGLLGNVYGVELTFADRSAGVVRPKEKMKTIVELDGSPRIHMPTHPPNRAAAAIKARLSEPLF
ncbi:uncharacterized protein CDAR_32951 [Caerostris darwini]|uniref:Uncharacterized protein n=1 Tax=Caerostris darwini TaxID=1538125 RepID=A0AAV4SMY3_9ARAC|nr:uncharacterized protein CDAR_32951 [Caerostris darwini]